MSTEETVAMLVERISQIESSLANGGRQLAEAKRTVVEKERELEEKDREIERLKKQVEKTKSKDEARVRSQRRQSMGLPSTLTTMTSSLTEPAFTSPSRGHGRVSVGFMPLDNDEESEGEGDESKSDESDDDSDSASVRRSKKGSKSRADKESKIIRKALSSLKPPANFSGETNAEKDRVEQWVSSVNNYLWGKLETVKAPEARMIMVRSLLSGSALDWVDSMYGDGVVQSWEQLQPLFIEHIRGSRDTKEQAREAMRRIAFGKGKCRPGDLLSYNSEFEALRVKLYPSSSTHAEMNEQAASDYLEGIRRGHLEFSIELRRGLMHARQPGVLPTLAEVKTAASRAWEIWRDLNKLAKTSSDSTTSSARSSRPSQHSTSSQSTVNNVGVDRVDGSDDETWERQEGEAEEPASVQTVNARRPNNRPTGGDQAGQPQRGYQLSDAQREQLGKLGRCFRCYGKGHKSWEKACPAKGKPQRAPTAEQLKA
jgi:hypothetical protein